MHVKTVPSTSFEGGKQFLNLQVSLKDVNSIVFKKSVCSRELLFPHVILFHSIKKKLVEKQNIPFSLKLGNIFSRVCL